MGIDSSRAGVPDFQWIRRNVPIVEVAQRLELYVQGTMARCWRPDQHQHADRTPSVGLHPRRNVAKCFVCDIKPLSPIDLAMSVLGAELAPAVAWITQRWAVPTIAKGKHLNPTQRWAERFRAGMESRLHTLVRSGIWALLTPAETSIFGALDTFTDGDQVTISYGGLMRYAGIGSRATVSAALRTFERLHMLSREPRTERYGLRAAGSYFWTFDSPEFEQVRDEIAGRQREEIALERQLRADRRRSITGTTLWSVSEPVTECTVQSEVNRQTRKTSDCQSDSTPRVNREIQPERKEVMSDRRRLLIAQTDELVRKAATP